ncbi:hypothetical protein [Flavobacterium sp. GCM10023249]|uniref:hypothetical protein n=1 Tax=unclassified Flavobacterium TaxID=196869 RepID=UPI00360C46FE
MEALGLLFEFIIIVVLFIFGSINLVKSRIKKDKTSAVICVLLMTMPGCFFFFSEIISPFSHKPTISELVGTYKIVDGGGEIPKEDFDKYTLILKVDQTFEFTPNPSIALCEKGQYSLDYTYEYNELTFQCGDAWTPKRIKRKLFGYEIEFFQGDRSICFAKVE